MLFRSVNCTLERTVSDLPVDDAIGIYQSVKQVSRLAAVTCPTVCSVERVSTTACHAKATATEQSVSAIKGCKMANAGAITVAGMHLSDLT